MATRFDNYQFRCSALGKIMSAKGDITQSNATYLTELFIGEVYNVKREISTVYFEKGSLCEEDGITLLQKTIHSGELLLKNKKRLHNEYIHGEADCLVGEYVYDIKNAFDLFTFGKADLTTDYYWQLVGYMWLWDKPKARLFYCLNNTPEHLLIDLERKLFYAGHFVSYDSEEYKKGCEELRRKHNYDHMPVFERFKVWDLSRDESDINKLKEKINKCRVFLNGLQDDFDTMTEKNKTLMGERNVIIAQHDTELNATIISKL